jgi:hypothetical protein
VEERNCLQAKIDLAARRCRYHTFSSHHHQLKVEKLKKQMMKVSKEVDAAVADAVNKHKASQPGQSTNVQNPNASGKFFPSLVEWTTANSSLTGGPVLTQGGPGRPAAASPQSVIIAQWL